MVSIKLVTRQQSRDRIGGREYRGWFPEGRGRVVRGVVKVGLVDCSVKCKVSADGDPISNKRVVTPLRGFGIRAARPRLGK